MPEKLVTIAAAAERLSVSELTVRRLIASGKLTGYRVGPRLLRIDAAELDQIARPIPTNPDNDLGR